MHFSSFVCFLLSSLSLSLSLSKILGLVHFLSKQDMSEIQKQPHSFPCLHCQPRTYIRMVQNLIERCLLLRMGREQCAEALAEHARIEPLVTLTVWKELQKENKDFFQSYFYHTQMDTLKEHQDLQQ